MIRVRATVEGRGARNNVLLVHGVDAVTGKPLFDYVWLEAGRWSHAGIVRVISLLAIFVHPRPLDRLNAGTGIVIRLARLLQALLEGHRRVRGR